MKMRIRKRLSGNDVGITGGHQAGILVPKDERILSFFPKLPAGTKNPRAKLVVREKSDGTRWEFSFIYYNNRLYGGTRNEYRLTCMTAYLRSVNAQAGDELVFSKDASGSIHVELSRTESRRPALNSEGVLVLGSGWVCINN